MVIIARKKKCRVPKRLNLLSFFTFIIWSQRNPVIDNDLEKSQTKARNERKR